MRVVSLSYPCTQIERLVCMHLYPDVWVNGWIKGKPADIYDVMQDEAATLTVNSEWLPGYNFVISYPGVPQQKHSADHLGLHHLPISTVFYCSTPGQGNPCFNLHMVLYSCFSQIGSHWQKFAPAKI